MHLTTLALTALAVRLSRAGVTIFTGPLIAVGDAQVLQLCVANLLANRKWNFPYLPTAPRPEDTSALIQLYTECLLRSTLGQQRLELRQPPLSARWQRLELP